MDNISEAELTNSLKILKQTISNLNEKLGFLIEQKSLYTDLHNDLLDYVAQTDDSDSNTTNDDEYSTSKNGKIIGELIISSKQIFKNIGYEYYEEIDREECIEFVSTKIKMIEKAIDQFESKIKECEDVLIDFDAFEKINSNNDSLGNDGKLEKTALDTKSLDVMGAEFPVMDIREELDENGNVLSSSVKPVTPKNSSETAYLDDKQNNNHNKASQEDKINRVNDEYQDFPKPGIMEIREELDADGNVIKGDVFSANDQFMNPKNKDSKKSFQPQDKNSAEINKSNSLKADDLEENEEFYELLEDMGIIENKAEYLNEKYNLNNNDTSLEKEPQIVEIIEDNDSVIDGIKENAEIGRKEKEEEKAEQKEKEEDEQKVKEEDEQKEKEEDEPIVQDIKEVDLGDIKILGTASSNKEYLKYTDPSKPAIDPKDLYTLEDIINKMDLASLESEEEEHEEEINDILKDKLSNNNTLPHLDYERFDKYFQDHDNTDDSDSDSEASWENDSDLEYSVVPGTAASNAFQEQILKLRQQKLQTQDNEETSQNIVFKSILKKVVSSTSDEPANNKPRKGGKKSVGFAEDLDIVVVENMKEETRKNTFGMADYYGMSFSGMDYDNYPEDLENSYDSTDNIKEQSTDEALSNLLQIPVEENTGQSSIVENTDASSQKSEPIKPKISKFKQNRLKRDKSKRNSMLMENDFSLNEDLATGSKEVIGSSSSGSKNLIDNFLETLESTSLEPDNVNAKQNGIEEHHNDAESFGVTTDIVERAPVEADIVLEGQPLSEDKSTPTISEKEKMKVFGKSFDSLSKPSFEKKEKTNVNEYTASDEEQANEYQTSESDLEKPLDLDVLKAAERLSSPPAQEETASRDSQATDTSNNHHEEKAHEIQEDKLEIIENPKVDYSQLNTMDELAQAYLMGLYDDDIVPQVGPYEPAIDTAEGPGFVVEKLDDFEEYNKTVEILKDEIDEFLIEKSNNDEIDENENDQMFEDAEENDEHTVMTDIIERSDFNEEECDAEDYPLQGHVLHEQIAKDYYTQRQKIIANQRSFEQFDPNDKSKEYEPIDEHGNPVKTSRFKSSRINTQSTKF
ncbi:hypothetical protein ACO0QE_003063 [Hanseniaspora vineae]